jgi:WD40 repeat protein
MKCLKCQAQLYPGEPACDQCGHPVEAAAPAPPREAGREPQGGREIRRFEGHQKEVWKVAFSPDGRRAISAGDDAIYIWDVETGRQLSRVLGKGLMAFCIDIARDGRHALFENHALALWDLEANRRVFRYEGHATAHTVAFSADGRSAFYGANNGPIHQFALVDGKEIRRLNGHTEVATALACSPDGRYLASTGMQAPGASELFTWDLTAGGQPVRPGETIDLPTCAAFSPDSRRVIFGTMEASVHQLDAATGRKINVCDAQDGLSVMCVAYSPTGRFFVSGNGEFGDDEPPQTTICVWDAQSAGQIGRLGGHTRNINSLAVSPDGRSALSGSSDKTVRLWQLPSVA